MVERYKLDEERNLREDQSAVANSKNDSAAETRFVIAPFAFHNGKLLYATVKIHCLHRGLMGNVKC